MRSARRAQEAMHANLPCHPLQLYAARLDLEAGHHLRGARDREDVVGDADLISSRQRLDPGGDVDRLPEVVEAIVGLNAESRFCLFP